MAPLAQLQQDIDRVLKRVDDSIQEFSSSSQEDSIAAKFRDIHDQHEMLKKLSNALQQDRSELQSLLGKGQVRKAQKERLKLAKVSVDNALESFQSFENKLSENEFPAKTASSAVLGEATILQRDSKVQWDQLLRETPDDCEMLEEFICKICQVHVVGCEPKLARCSHLFCGDCIATWFEVQPRSQSWAQRAQSAGCVPCPVCKEPLHEERDLFPVCSEGQNECALLYRLLSGVKIACGNSAKCCAEGKCTWTGTYASYQKHFQACKNVSLDNAPSESKVLETKANSIWTKARNIETNVQEDVPDKCENDVDKDATEHDLKQDALQPALQQTPVEPVNVASAIRSFETNDPSQLAVQVGELIQVLSQHESGWTYGRKGDESVGWFPNWAIA